MTKEKLIEFIEEEYGVIADYPFANEWAPTPIFRHTDNRKWFALAMYVSKNKLTGSSEEKVWAMNVKCDPLLKSVLFEKKGFYTAYHMNKEHWISIILEEADEEDILFALSVSFDLTKKKYKKKNTK